MGWLPGRVTNSGRTHREHLVGAARHPVAAYDVYRIMCAFTGASSSPAGEGGIKR